MKAELMINGPRGQTWAELEVQPDGSIQAHSIEAAAAHAGNLYNELEQPNAEIERMRIQHYDERSGA